MFEQKITFKTKVGGLKCQFGVGEVSVNPSEGCPGLLIFLKREEGAPRSH